MSSWKFLHAADIHLDSPMRNLAVYEGAPVEQLRDATRRALEQLVRTAIAHQVKLVLLAGDLFDGAWKDVNTGLFFAGQMRQLADADITVVAITGNHDATAVQPQRLRMPDTYHLLNATRPQSLRLDALDTVVHGQSYGKRECAESLAAQYPAAVPGCFNIGVLHTSLEGNAQHATYAPCSMNELLAKGYEYWALGHIHKREILKREPSWIVYPGNIQGRHINEPGARGCYLVTVSHGTVAGAEFVELDAVRWERVELDASSAGSLDVLEEQFLWQIDQLRSRHGDRLLAVRVMVKGATEFDASWRKNFEAVDGALKNAAVDARGVWLEEVQLRTTPPHASSQEFIQVIDSVGAGWSADPGRYTAILEAAQNTMKSVQTAQNQIAGDPLFPEPAEYPELLDEALALLRATILEPGKSS